MEMEKLKKLTVVMFLISLLALSCSIDTVEADASDCNDACTTACVQPNTRLMRRCEIKCGIRCSPGAAAAAFSSAEVDDHNESQLG
ncbi:hypothetical protein LINGRAHAP2_LOCUS14246 [Linum grandiflorum]